MEKQNPFCQFKSGKLWKDSITVGFAIFGFLSGASSIIGISFSKLFADNAVAIISATIIALVISYLVAVIWKWWTVRKRVTLKIRGIKVTVRQGDLFDEDGWKVICVDDTISTSEDNHIISHLSLHGKLIKNLKEAGEIEAFSAAVGANTSRLTLGRVKTYKDYILLSWTHLNKDNEAHINSSSYENILRKMWQEIGRVYAGKPINLPILGDGITRFDGMSQKPGPMELLRCMICTLKMSDVQLKAPVTIVVYDRINEINLYNLKGFESL